MRIVGVGLCLVASAVLVASMVSSSSKASDEVAIKDLISKYALAHHQGHIVPAYALSAVEARQAEILAKSEAPIDEGEAHQHVLPEKAIVELNERYDAMMASFCTKRRAEASKMNWAEMIDASLYNNPQEPPLVDVQNEVLAIQVKKRDSQTCVVWALQWAAEYTTQGKKLQDWTVWEYQLVDKAGGWRIDGVTPLAWLGPTSSDWGPNAPHQDMSIAELSPGSCLYPGQFVPREELSQLEAAAVN